MSHTTSNAAELAAELLFYSQEPVKRAHDLLLAQDARIAELGAELLREHADHTQTVEDAAAVVRENKRLEAEVTEWRKLRDPVTLHANLLRGLPARLGRDTFLHIAGDGAALAQQVPAPQGDPHEREPIDQSTIDCWRINYGLDKRTPAEAAKWWQESPQGHAPSGCVAALGVALDELEAERNARSAQQVPERELLRAAQASAVMPLIGPLLDAWECCSQSVREEQPELDKELRRINRAMEDAAPVAQQVPADPEDTGDLVTIPRGLIGAACAAIDHKRDAPKLLEKLRRYTVGDLSRQPAQQVPTVPKGWQVKENNGVFFVTAPNNEAAAVVYEFPDNARTIPEEVLWLLLRDLTAAAPLPAPTPEQPAQMTACPHDVPHRWACDICDSATPEKPA